MIISSNPTRFHLLFEKSHLKRQKFLIISLSPQNCLLWQLHPKLLTIKTKHQGKLIPTLWHRYFSYKHKTLFPKSRYFLERSIGVSWNFLGAWLLCLKKIIGASYIYFVAFICEIMGTRSTFSELLFSLFQKYHYNNLCKNYLFFQEKLSS